MADSDAARGSLADSTRISHWLSNDGVGLSWMRWMMDVFDETLGLGRYAVDSGILENSDGSAEELYPCCSGVKSGIL